MYALRKMSMAVVSKASTTSKAYEPGEEPQDAPKDQPAEGDSGLFESVDFVPPAHTTCYKLWVVCCSVWIVLFIPLSLTAFAMGYRPTRATTPPQLTTDPIWLTVENQPPCQEQFPSRKAATGSIKKRASSILCVFNTSAHRRPLVSRMVLGYIPGFICKHVLYSSILMPDPEGALQSLTPEFDMECAGLASVKVLKKRFQHIKVYTVLSANTPALETVLFTLASGRLDKLVKFVRDWIVKFSFDGLFVSWSQPFALEKSRVLFSRLAVTLRPEYTLGAILPWQIPALQNYDTVSIASNVDWIIMKTHGFYPRKGYNFTSCPSPYQSSDDRTTISEILKYHLVTMRDHMNLSRVCFTVSFRATGYRVTDRIFSGHMRTQGPGNLNRYTGDNGIIAYPQVCKLEVNSAKSNTAVCSYTKRRGNVSVDQGFCVGVWDLDLDDYKGSCTPKKHWPLLEALAGALP
ncbi:chitinase-3-like protein 1 isoform X2 [Dermacentor albipictus]|uniref:chitinase-3-like protein 1 isoform X2 n=1 Tax=Dermacentor albipictus TaxID=60249 RepID=UPI0031FBCE6D